MSADVDVGLFVDMYMLTWSEESYGKTVSSALGGYGAVEEPPDPPLQINSLLIRIF